MTVEWRALGESEVDHALVWSLVGCATGGLVGLAALQGATIDLVCPFRALTSIPCPTCGATRALTALAAGQVTHAFRLNPLVISGCVIAALYLAYAAIVTLTSARRVAVTLTRREWNFVRRLALGAALGTWVFLVIDGR